MAQSECDETQTKVGRREGGVWASTEDDALPVLREGVLGARFPVARPWVPVAAGRDSEDGMRIYPPAERWNCPQCKADWTGRKMSAVLVTCIAKDCERTLCPACRIICQSCNSLVCETHVVMQEIEGQRKYYCPSCAAICAECGCNPCACPAPQQEAQLVVDTARAIVGGLTAEQAYGKGPQQGRLM